MQLKTLFTLSLLFSFWGGLFAIHLSDYHFVLKGGLVVLLLFVNTVWHAYLSTVLSVLTKDFDIVRFPTLGK